MNVETMTKKKEKPSNTPAPKRVRMIFDTDEEIRMGVHFRSLRDDINTSDVINAALRAYLASDIAQAKRYKEQSED